MAERTVKHLSIRYWEEAEHPFQISPETGKPLKTLQLRTASFGERVNIERTEDLKRLEHYGAIATEEEQEAIDAAANQSPLEQLGVEPGDSAGGASDLSNMSTEELGEWISTTGPTVNELLEKAHDNPDLAERLIDAENLATNNDPRTTLVEGLAKIMADRNQ